MTTPGNQVRPIKSTALAGVLTLALGSPALAQQHVVTLDTGGVLGAGTQQVTSFKGIPYAAPPIGELRWRAPQPVQPWATTRESTAFGPDCLQKPFPSDAAPLGGAVSEDCLYLNVWKPASAKPGDKLPVMVWIYGGGFVNGGSSPGIYDGTHFAEQGLIFVSFNYRIGRFGFFGFPELTRQNADGLLGNYGFMDQISALRWVQRNIGAFGGDAGKVTVAGESAGGFSVHMLLTSPLATGLFSKAIIESGGGRVNVGGLRYLSTSLPHGLPSGEDAGVKFAAALGIKETGADALEKLRRLPAEAIVGDLNMATMGTSTYSGPVIDGKIVLAEPQTVYLAGAGAKVPLLVGANDADIGILQADSKSEVFATFGLFAAQAAAIYDPAGTAPLQQILSAVASDRAMVEPARFVATAFSASGHPVFEYRFSYVAQSLRGHLDGAPHATEIPYVFGTVRARYGAETNSEDERVAQQTLNYWAAFVKNGEPKVEGQPAWPVYSAKSDQLMNFTPSGPVVQKDPWRERLDLTAKAISGLAPKE